jgi:hypothetical protein
MRTNFLDNFPVYPVEGNHDFGHMNSEDFNSIDPMLKFDA